MYGGCCSRKNLIETTFLFTGVGVSALKKNKAINLIVVSGCLSDGVNLSGFSHSASA
jgi:hypothetical protein